MITDDCTILVTGAHGFLGKHVVKKLEEYREGGNSGSRRGITILTPKRTSLDLLDADCVHAYLIENKPDVIIHLAAQCGGIGINREKPGEFLYNNMMMTTNLIEQARILIPRCKFVGVGTVCSYPKHTPVPFKEEDLFNGYPEETNAPYGVAKRVQLEMLKAYKAQYGLDGVFLIPVNMYGEYDNFDDSSSHVIPAMMKKFHHAKLNNEPDVVLWGTGTASREFLYAGDCAEAILRATLLYNESDPVNIGTGSEITIEDLAYKIREVVGYQGDITWDASKPNGQPRRCLDTSRAKEKFGFEARANFDETLSLMYRWAQENDVL